MKLTNFKARRDKVLSMMEDGIAIIPAATHLTRSNDTEFPFRQNSNFKYLSGFHEADSILVLCQHNNEFSQALFVLPKDDMAELWMGKRTGEIEAKDKFDFDASFSIDDFDKMLPELLAGHKNLYIDMFDNDLLFSKVKKQCQKLTTMKKRASHSPTKIIHVNHFVENLRLVKDQNEIQTMKKAMKATDIAHRAAMAMTAPGKNEKDVADLMEYLCKKNGTQGVAYDSIVAAGPNGCVLHYIENNSNLIDKEMLLIDAGSELNLYATDISRTFPINGKFTTAQKALYEIVLNAQKNSISKARIGNTLTDCHNASVNTLTQGLIDLGILKGSLEENIKSGSFRKYYPHGTSHWLGMDVHDQNPYLDEKLELIKFEPGMIFTVEPGLYLPIGDANVPLEYQGMAIRIEDDILITETGYENLSAMIPKEVSEIEEACTKDYKDFLI